MGILAMFNLLLVITVVYGAKRNASPLFASDGPVKVIANDFQSFVDNSKALVMFYAPWDEKSVSASKPFTEAAEENDGESVFAAVDCTKMAKVCKSYKLKSMPVFMYFDKSGELASGRLYEGPRLKGNFLNFVRNPLQKGLI